jgi:hypothetical protein
MPIGIYKRKPMTQEHKDNISRSMKGKQNTLGKEPWNKGKTGIYSDETLLKMSKNKKIYRGEEHPSWNPNPTYSGIHQWIGNVLGSPKECSKCNFTSDNSRQFHWANISGKYLRDVNDWVRLCVSCHFKMDKIHERGWKTRKKLK